MALLVTVYHCEECGGPVVAVTLADAGPVGDAGALPPPGHVEQVGQATCKRCGHAQNEVPADAIEFPGVPWEE